MKRVLFFLTAWLVCTLGRAQSLLQGHVTSKSGRTVSGANVYLLGSAEGTTTDSIGKFSLRTRLSGAQQLVVSAIGYQRLERNVLLGTDTTAMELRLVETNHMLNEVNVSAGLFEAGDERRMTTLKFLDVVTTAGAGADIPSVMQFLPGTSRVGEQEGLFVRGGSASETQTLIDGMIVQNPFYSSIPDIAQRGRFDPSLFKGMAFSTGGYSAQYGQALSSVLLLDTQDKLNDLSKLTFDVNPTNAALSYTHHGSLTGRVSCTSMQPYFWLVRQTRTWPQPPQGLDASVIVKEKLSATSSLKCYATTSHSRCIVDLPDYDQPGSLYSLVLRNQNYFSTNSYQKQFAEGKWGLQAGLSYSYNSDYIRVAGNKSLDRSDQRTQGRLVLTRFLSGNHTLLAGLEVHQIHLFNDLVTAQYALDDSYRAAFVEGEFHLGLRLAVRLGGRAERAGAIGQGNVAPRLSVAYRVGSNSQVSFATGEFYQTPDKNYIYHNQNLDFEQANHFILNYQYAHNDRTLRLEAYYKRYAHLVREQQVTEFDPDPYRVVPSTTDNSGYGYAQGLDFFYRDQKSIKNGDFWVSYSLLDTKRLAENYLALAMPTYTSRHNLSLVYKHSIPNLGLSLGGTYRYASGRTYYQYGAPEFLGDRLKPYSNLAVTISKLLFIKKNYIVFYVSVDNVLGTRNVYGSRYSSDGMQRYEVQPPAYRTVFAGVSINLSVKN